MKDQNTKIAAQWFTRGVSAGIAAMVAGCGTGLADYCAPGTPECTAVEGGIDAGVLPADASQPRFDASDGSMAPEDAEASGDAGADGPGEGGDAFVCDPKKAPSEDPCVLSETYGVFVSPSGTSGGAGTKGSPVSSVGRGIDLAKAAGKAVFVCAGTYAEKLVVGISRDGVSVYGGLDCATWGYSPANHVSVSPSQTGYALELDGLVTGLRLEDIEFDAQDASSAPGESSVAAFVNGSQNVVLRRVTLVAGALTATGAAGTSGASSTNHSVQSLNGSTAMSAAGGGSTTCTCVDRSTSTGGQGGGNAQSPGPGLPSYGVDGGGSAGTNGTGCGAGSTTNDGTDAPTGVADAPGAALGTVSATGWTPSGGTAGSNGKPGQGGGGGGNGKQSSGGGGGGACGGCGGAGGRPGGAGGSSIALLSFHSVVTLTNGALTAKAAGGGGAGGNGEPGQVGGSAGTPFGAGPGAGCPGGAGGTGAGGNGAQGGPGGLSAGIVFSGTVPTVNGSTVSSTSIPSGILVGAKGVGGAKGTAGAAAGTGIGQPGVDGPPGQPGVAQPVLQLP